ncbi:MAG: hypothetical protein ACYS21_17925, partial [Planctomycetota bacterium]|jgi:hypothetical protein
VTLDVNKDGRAERLEGRCVVFSSTSSSHWRSEANFLVFYLFNVNGDYAGSREGARIALNKNLLGKYSYFSKVEWKFFNARFGQRFQPSKEEAVRASEKLLAVLLPVLEREHWPAWLVADRK